VVIPSSEQRRIRRQGAGWGKRKQRDEQQGQRQHQGVEIGYSAMGMVVNGHGWTLSLCLCDTSAAPTLAACN
jgi:hypothetical protein